MSCGMSFLSYDSEGVLMVQLDFSFGQRTCRWMGSCGIDRWGMFRWIFESVFWGFVDAVPIRGVWDVFSEFQFRFRVCVSGAGGFLPSCRECGV